jgi:ElaB/YqjD/DUF883 family membrane-anchored ribosome-binding protein
VAETGQPYAFTLNDPLNTIDPLGLKSNSSGIFEVLMLIARIQAEQRALTAFLREMAEIAQAQRELASENFFSFLAHVARVSALNFWRSASINRQAANRIPVLGAANRYVYSHPFQSVQIGGTLAACGVSAGLGCAVAGFVSTSANLGADLYHGCSAGQTIVDLTIGLSSAGLAGISSLGEPALDGSRGLQSAYRIHQTVIGAGGQVVSACSG